MKRKILIFTSSVIMISSSAISSTGIINKNSVSYDTPSSYEFEYDNPPGGRNGPYCIVNPRLFFCRPI
jgi:hypothetical protein